MEGIIYLFKKKSVLLKLNDFPECDVKMEVFENFSIFTFLEGMTATFMYIQNHIRKM